MRNLEIQSKEILSNSVFATENFNKSRMGMYYLTITLDYFTKLACK